MKKVKKGFLIVFFMLIFLTGCKKINVISYTGFLEFFNNKDGFEINDRTIDYENIYQRCYEVTKDDLQIMYYEFKTSEEAKKYVEENYLKKDSYNTKIKKSYSIVTSSSKGYFYLIQKENIIIVGNTENKKSKKSLKKLFAELVF